MSQAVSLRLWSETAYSLSISEADASSIVSLMYASFRLPIHTIVPPVHLNALGIKYDAKVLKCAPCSQPDRQ